MFNLYKLSDAKSRSISAENFSGEKGKGGMAAEGTGKQAARELGLGWKVSPSVDIPAESEFVIADINGPGKIEHIWMTMSPDRWRNMIIKIYWDGEKEPSVFCPAGDFFCNGWCERTNVNSLPVVVVPAGGFNSYWEMPFRKSAKIVIQNTATQSSILYYQIDYSLQEVSVDSAYFHAYWRRENPVKYKKPYTIIEDIKGKGHYVGTYLAWQVNNCGWWGEGEIKFFIDGDREFPTICGTGTEDYFGGAWNFEHPRGEYGSYSTPFLGMNVIKPDALYRSQQRFSMYRWHIMDPIRFEDNLSVTIQALGWRSNGRYLPLQDDISSVAVWYQTEPHNKFLIVKDKDHYEVI